MTCRTIVIVLIVVIAALSAIFAIPPAAAQGQCPLVDRVVFPLDADPPQMTQAFAAQNTRFHGRFHTGEDWIAQPTTSLGAVVRAVAGGRVTFASPTAWGRDGGVIIIEHALRDGSVVYSMYGHVTDSFGQPFPAAFTCVEAGQVIAAIADVRPAPHLHWEVRTVGSNTPGAGYAWRYPTGDGLLRPSQWLAETAASLHPAFAWQAAVSEVITAPVLLPGGDLIALDGDRVVGVSYDGRLLWRYALDRAAVGLLPAAVGAVIVYADGGLQPIGADGSAGTSRSLPHAIRAALTDPTGGVYFDTPDGLVAYDPGLTTPRWTATDAAGAVAVHADAAGSIVVVMTAGATGTASALTLTAATGAVLDRADLRERGSLGLPPTGALLPIDGVAAYTRGGLWQIAPDGTWSLLLPTAEGGGQAGAVAWGDDGTDDGWTYTFTGTTLTAWDRQGVPRWTGALTDTAAAARSWLAERADRLYVIAGDGLTVLNVETGTICAQIPIWRGSLADVWAALGDDDTLRISSGGTLVGFDLAALRRTCG